MRRPCGWRPELTTRLSGLAEACGAEIDAFAACAELKSVTGPEAGDLEHPFYKAEQCQFARRRSELCVIEVCRFAVRLPAAKFCERPERGQA
jgi:hypothetical protein